MVCVKVGAKTQLFQDQAGGNKGVGGGSGGVEGGLNEDVWKEGGKE